MHEMGWWLLGLIAICVALFILALYKRWLARIPHGFFYAILLAIAGAGVACCALMATFGYETARTIVVEQRVGQLSTAADILSDRLTDRINDVLSQLHKVAAHISADASGTLRVQEAQQLTDLDLFSELILQIHVLDRAGRLVMQTGDTKDIPVPPSDAIAEALQGRTHISDPIFIERLHRYVLELCMPAQRVNGSVSGAVCVCYDLDASLGDLLHGIHFATTGYSAVTDARGHLIAHPQARRLGEDISSYPAVERGRRGETGWMVTTNRSGHVVLMVYQPVSNPSSSGHHFVFLAEMHLDEALEPTRNLLLRFGALTLVLVLACCIVAIRLSRYLRRPLGELMAVMHAVEQSDLTARSLLEGRDELGIMAASLNRMVGGLEERERIKDLFGRYVTTQVSEAVLHGQLRMGGEKRRLTILFSDIRNFTTMSEFMPAEEVVAFLNDYFSQMVDAVFEYGGILDKFIGDGMLAEFGAFGEADHARAAVLAALRMKEALQGINETRRQAGLPPIGIGIGIHTADVIVGNIGSRKRLDYTAIGDGVNTASRVESVNKQFGTTILITQDTLEALPAREFACRRMPPADLKGKTVRLTFYEVMAWHPDGYAPPVQDGETQPAG